MRRRRLTRADYDAVYAALERAGFDRDVFAGDELDYLLRQGDTPEQIVRTAERFKSRVLGRVE